MTSSKSNPAISGDPSSATSSPASAPGPAPLERLDGQMILGYGQAAVPAKVSVQAGSGRASQISVTYGPHGSGSSASAHLTSALVSRLRRKTDSLGSTLFRLTWKERVTPSGRRIPALRASGRRTSEADCTSWPSPKAQEDGSTVDQYQARRLRGYENRKGKTSGGPSGKQGGLSIAAQMASWPTPVDDDANNGTRDSGMYNSLTRTARLVPWATASWSTPRGEDSECAGAHRGIPDGLHSQAKLATWSTPSSRDWKDTAGMSETGTNPDGTERTRLDQLPRQASLTVSGATPSGSGAATKSIGQLRPGHSRWLMGLPAAWESCADTVTLLSRRKPKASSKRT